MTSNRENRMDLSLSLGGPLYQTYLRFRLARVPIELVTRRIIAFVVIAWVPLAVLSAMDGYAMGGVKVPFFEHIGAHVRFLIVLPLLIAAEVIVHQRITLTVRQFNERGLIAPEDETRFEDVVGDALRLRNSATVELVLLILAFTLGTWLWKDYGTVHSQTWYSPGIEGIHFTFAGYWYAFVSLPLLRFLVLRWYFRLFVWYRFLWNVSQMPLRLNGLHPDRAGGLGFLEITPSAFLLLLWAHTALLAGGFADRIWHQGATLLQFKMDVVVVMIFLLLLVYTPLMFFVMGLFRARWAGRRDFGSFASCYVTEFRNKWINNDPGNKSGAPLGSGDIQSLADLDNSFRVVEEMRIVPFQMRSVLRLAGLVILPLTPLVLTVIPIDQIIDRLIKLAL